MPDAKANGTVRKKRLTKAERQARAVAAELELMQKRRRVIELRAARMTWQAIADDMGYVSASTALRAYQEAVQALPIESLDELRRAELESLDRAERSLWPDIRPVAQADDQGAARRNYALMQLRWIKERRAALMGLDAPKKSESTVRLLREEAAELARQLGVPDGELDVETVLAQADQLLRESA